MTESLREALSEAEVEEPGVDGVSGRAWARGYMRGTKLAPEGWSRIFQDDRVASAQAATARHSERAPYERAGPKVGRNDPCPCGSGKKYKRCCGAGGAEDPVVH